MTAPAVETPSAKWISPVLGALAAGVIVGLAAIGWSTASPKPVEVPVSARVATADEDETKLDLSGGVAWLNTAGPLTAKDLKGKIVVLDFWTLCCINCIHILPDLAKLEKKYGNELVVIGVHSAKFENEKDTKSIRKAILRYEIAHPVVNDADHKIWERYNVSSWPTFAVFDPTGKLIGVTSGEGQYEILDAAISRLVDKHKKDKSLDVKPIRFDLVRFREKGDTPLFFPGKILVDEKGKRLFISDSTHHRVIVTDLDGKKIAIAGTGSPGRLDGKFGEALFDDPQGLALDGDTLYVADRKNHSIRALDLKTETVSTVAGNGRQSQESRYLDRPGKPTATGLNSPWDLLLVGKELFIAMAGHHQIWKMDLEKNTVVPFAGDGGENIKDGPMYASRFAQPSGLATDGKFLYVADSEVSAIRKLPLDGEGRVETIVGQGLFDFGDKDGTGKDVRLQHALGVAARDGKLIVADTYNSKLKLLDPKTKKCTTIEIKDGDGKSPAFNEPAGISIAGNKAYIADTNAHRIRVVDLTSNKVTTLELKGIEPPPPQKEWQPPEPEKKK